MIVVASPLFPNPVDLALQKCFAGKSLVRTLAGKFTALGCVNLQGLKRLLDVTPDIGMCPADLK